MRAILLNLMPNCKFKVPEVGFNTVKANHESVLYRGLGDENENYFVHS